MKNELSNCCKAKIELGEAPQDRNTTCYYCKKCGKPCNLYDTEQKNKIVAGLLAIFLGGLGIHKFYLNKGVSGIIYILFCWTYIPSIIGFIEGIIYLLMDEKAFNKKYN